MQRDNLFTFLWDVLRRNPLVGLCMVAGTAAGGILMLVVFFREPSSLADRAGRRIGGGFVFVGLFAGAALGLVAGIALDSLIAWMRGKTGKDKPPRNMNQRNRSGR